MKHCEPICREWQGWDMPVMAPFSPSKHGVVQCRSLKYNDLDGFTNNDGAGGDWPVSEPPNEGVHKHPGVIAADSVNGEGTIDYWRCDGDFGQCRKGPLWGGDPSR